MIIVPEALLVSYDCMMVSCSYYTFNNFSCGIGIGVTSKMNIEIAISILIIIIVLKLGAGMEKCNVCYCETGKFGMSDIRWLYIYTYLNDSGYYRYNNLFISFRC